MSWRTVVISSCAKLDYQLGYLVVRNETVSKIYLKEMGLLIIESTAVSLTAALLSELMKQKIKVVFCDEKRNPSSELVPYYTSYNTSAKIRRQVLWSQDTKLFVWTEIVVEKIRKQAGVLRFANCKEVNLLEEYIDEIEFGDKSNREGHAAKVYFNALFGKGFTRNQENAVNSALNYGYSILLSAFNREIVSNGYLTQLGIFHDNTFNHFNLSSDFMEPFRPLVDLEVYLMSPIKFEQEEKMRLVQILGREVVIGGRRETVDNAIKIYCKSMLDALDEADISMIKFYSNEL